MNVIYAVLDENPAWNEWTGDGQERGDDPPPEFIVKLKLPGVERAILEIPCDGYTDRYGDDEWTKNTIIADALRDFFASLIKPADGG
jgi:hypothetical protein